MRVSAAILLFLSACCLAVRGYDRPAASTGPARRQLSSAALLLARADGSSLSPSLSLVSAKRSDVPATQALRGGAPHDGEISASCGAGFAVPKLRLNLRGGGRRVRHDEEEEEDEEDEEEGSESDEEVRVPSPTPALFTPHARYPPQRRTSHLRHSPQTLRTAAEPPLGPPRCEPEWVRIRLAQIQIRGAAGR